MTREVHDIRGRGLFLRTALRASSVTPLDPFPVCGTVDRLTDSRIGSFGFTAVGFP